MSSTPAFSSAEIMAFSTTADVLDELLFASALRIVATPTEARLASSCADMFNSALAALSWAPVIALGSFDFILIISQLIDMKHITWASNYHLLRFATINN
jgi:hypothetical protein